MVYGGAVSADTVAMNYASVQEAAGRLATCSKGMDELLETCSRSLDPVRQTWYASGSQSGAEAQIAETNLRTAMTELNQVIRNIANLLNQSAADAATLDNALGRNFEQHTVGRTA